MSSKRASVNPLAGFLKPRSPAERLAAQQQDREKLQREAAQGAARGRGKGKGRGWEEACGATARLQEQAPFSHSPLFLPFLFPHLRLPLCVAIAACNPLTSLSLLLSTVQHQPQLQP